MTIYFYKALFILLLLFAGPAVLFSQKTAVLYGKVFPAPETTMIQLSSNMGFSDSVIAKDGAFQFVIPCDSVWDAYFIRFPGISSTFAFPVLLKANSQISLHLDLKTYHYEISGDKNADEQDAFWKGLGSQNQVDAFPKNWVTAHRSSPFSAAVVRMFIASTRTKEDTVGEKYFDLLLPEARANNYQAELLENGFALFSSRYKNRRLSMGNNISDFVIKDTSGKDIRLRDFKDKYLLIDFWASWCGPCRESTPSIRRLYNKYSRNGLEVLSISFDTDSKKWKGAIKADKMNWPQGSDLMGEGGGVGLQYQIIAIPQFVLIAPDGRIIFNFSSGDVDSLEAKLKGIFNSN